MMARSNRKTTHTATTAQPLGSLTKSARDIMRKDKGLSGDLDRLPMLTWIMFLKFLDDAEQIEESRSKLRKGKYRSMIEPPYRCPQSSVRSITRQDNGNRPKGLRRNKCCNLGRKSVSFRHDDRSCDSCGSA